MEEPPLKRTVAIVLAIVVLLTGLPARAADHLVSISDMQGRLTQAVAQRQADLTAVRSALVSLTGVSAATRVGFDARAWVGRVAVLSDEELWDLAQRTALLQNDPAAGGGGKAPSLAGLGARDIVRSENVDVMR
jgi:hypothetical protein